MSIADASVNEGDSGTTNLTFTISLSATSASDVTVDYATSNGSATAGSDYTVTNGSITFTAGETSKMVTVSVMGDTDYEADESLALNLTNVSGATLVTATALGTITNDDAAPPTPVSLSVGDASIAEGDSGTRYLTFTINLSAAVGGSVTVDHVTSDGSATAGSDYTAATGTATITAGNTSTTVSVSVSGDTDVENDETFTLVLSNASGATLGTASATGTILNDDSAPLPNLSVSNTNVTEGNSGTTNLTFTLNLNTASASNVTVDYATSNGTATAGSDYTATTGTATITAGNTSTTVAVSVSGDTDVEGNETFTLTLSNVSNANLSIATAVGTIIDDDVVAAGGPYTMYTTSSGSLNAVDVTDPASTTQILPGPFGNSDVGSGSMIITGDVGASSVTNFRPDTFVYYDAGKFWRIDLSESSSLTPTQVSNVSSGYVCDMKVIDNVITPSDSYIVYVVGTDQNDCKTNGQARAIQLSDDSSTSPKSLPGGPYLGQVYLDSMETSATPGQVTGFIVWDLYNHVAIRTDANFANPVVLRAGSTSMSEFNGGSHSPQEDSFYEIDGVIYSYVHDVGPEKAMHTITTGSNIDYLQNEHFVCNTTDCYFVEVDGSNVQSLYRAAIDGSGSSQIGSDFVNEEVLGLTMTNGRLYFITAPAAGGQTLYAVDVAAVTPIPAPIESLSGSDYFTRLIAVGDFLYYSSVNAVADSVTAKVKKDDNSVPISPIANAMWAGFVFTNVQVGVPFEPSELILAEDVTSPTAGVKYTTYDAATAAAGNVLGTLDGFFVGKDAGSGNWSGTLAYGFGTAIVGWGFFDAPPSYTTDVFVANATSVGSLQNVTNTPATSEVPLF